MLLRVSQVIEPPRVLPERCAKDVTRVWAAVMGGWRLVKMCALGKDLMNFKIPLQTGRFLDNPSQHALA